jgi:hypothetical protein
MSCCPFRCRGVLAGLAAVLVGLVAGCPSASSTSGPPSKPAPAETSKPAKENGTTPKVTPPEHIPGS